MNYALRENPMDSKSPAKDKQQKITTDFDDVVNMTAAQLGKWLRTRESKTVGWSASGAGESVGHRSGRRIVDILGKRKDKRTRADLQHMAKVVGYVHRHLAQRPEGDIETTPWRYSLMNWGHDPVKD